MMTCREVLDFIADYLDGKLPLGQRLSFGFHLVLCRNCRNYIDGYRKTIKECKDSMTHDSTPSEVPEELVKAILNARNEK